MKLWYGHVSFTSMPGVVSKSAAAFDMFNADYLDYIGVIYRLYRDNGKENGNC